MKKILTLMLAVSICLIFAGCSSKPNPVTGYKKGDVVLGQYKGLTYTRLSEEVTDEQIENKIKTDLENNGKMVDVSDRAVQNGDTAVIDFEGKIDGVAFENGTAQDYELVVGAGRMIPGFEEGIVGIGIGETKVIDVTFPDEYPSNPDLAGKPATFDITVKSIKEKLIPELTEDFAKTTLGYDSIDAYRAHVRSDLEEEARQKAESQKFSDIRNAALNNATFKKDLTEEIAKTKNSMISNYNSIVSQVYGVDAATYYNYIYGMSAEQFDAYMESQAKPETQYYYLLSAIVEAEKITLSDAEIEEYTNTLLGDYNVSSAEELYYNIQTSTGVDGKTMVIEQAKLNKANDLIMDSAVENK